jgi:tetratricopeptide (TPR) repeat protein
MLAKAEQYNDAVEQLEQAVALRPGSLAPHYELATTYFRQGKFVPAIAEAERAVAIKPGDFGSQQTLALSRIAAGRTAAAVAPLEQALNLVPPASTEAASIRKTLDEIKSK